MANFTAGNSTAPPPSPAAHHEISTSNAVVCLVALITVPMVAYTLFMAIKCNRNPFRWSGAAAPAAGRRTSEKLELICGLKYRKDGAAEEASGINDQCPVCLSAFAEGEEIRQLGACRHVFHAACVDMWLYSHSSCPVCRAAVAVRRTRIKTPADGEEDLRQGLPDAVDLI